MNQISTAHQKRFWREQVAPTLVLVIICLVTTMALAVTYQITKPVIAEMNRVLYERTQLEVLPQAEEGFEPYQGDLLVGIKSVSLSRQDVGKVITAIERGYGGPLTVMVGISYDGTIQGIQVLSHAETPGLGSKTMNEEHLNQYIGNAKITKTHVEGARQIDAIAGATISSDAIYRAVDHALSQYINMRGDEE